MTIRVIGNIEFTSQPPSQTKHKSSKIEISGLIQIHSRKQAHLFSSGGLLALGQFTKHWPKTKHGNN